MILNDISGISIILLIVGIVELLKKLNIQGNILILISVLIGTIFGVLIKVYEIYPATHTYIEIGVFAIAFGLGAAGLYDLTKRLRTGS